tara:strand:- start:1041 stop:1286 length:246 start_codon:yes stop_codon:yes gene_type:complete
MMEAYPTGTVVIHKKKPEFGYGIVVSSFSTGAGFQYGEEDSIEDCVAIVLWHGDEEREIIETPQAHTYSELKILNTTVGFA